MKDFEEQTIGGRADSIVPSSVVGNRISEEYSQVDSVLEGYGVKSTVTVFGSARIMPLELSTKNLEKSDIDIKSAEKSVELSKFYEDAREFSRLVSVNGKVDGISSFIATGGGPGIMEAANRGSHEAGVDSIGFGIEIPFEKGNNQFVSPHLSFQFKYFLIRKFHLMKRAKCLVVFPGGIGSIDEMAEAITLRQTGKTSGYPIILYGKEFWSRVLDLDYLVDYGTMSASDLDLVRYADTPEEALRMVP